MTTNMNILDIIDLKYEEYRQFLYDIVSIESPTTDKKAVNEVVKYIKEFCEGKGFFVRSHEFEAAGDFLSISTQRSAEKPTILFLAHMDTVHPKGSFGKQTVRIMNEKIYGPGVADCKGGIAVALLAMEAVSEVGSDYNLKLILTSDKEDNVYSGDEGALYICKEASGAVAAFNCECGVEGEAVTGRKGMMRWYVDIIGKAAHSGTAYDQGISAIREAAHKIVEIEKESEPEGITYNCGVIEGGSVPNIIPERCRFTVDIRFRNKEEREAAYSRLKAICDESYTGAQAILTLRNQYPPMVNYETNEELLSFMNKTSEKYALDIEPLSPSFSGGGSDSAYTTAVGVPTVDGIGISGGGFHTVNEYANLESIAENAKRLAVCVLNMKEFSL